MLRRYAAEFVGTFAIVFAPCAWSATSAMDGGSPGLASAAWVSGLAVLAMIYALGPISAAHFNPAVTLGFAIAKRFPWRFVGGYWLSQFGGAILAAGLVSALFGPGFGLHQPTSVAAGLGLEVIITFLLMFVIIAVATDSRVSSTAPAIAIGLTVVFCVLIGGPVTGGSMNPARSFAPALLAGKGLSTIWLYFVGPAAGAALAALGFEAIRPDPQFAKGAPNELLEALEGIQAQR